MTATEMWMNRVLLVFASISLPVCIFYPASPNMTYSALGLISLGLLVLRKNLGSLVPPLKHIWLFLGLILWALLACLWSPIPETSLHNVAKIPLAVLGAVSFYAARTQESDDRFMKVYAIGFDVALLLLILDETLNTHILRSLRGPNMATPEYYHGVTLLIFSLWPVLNAIKTQHAASKILLIGLLLLGVFEMTDHAAKLALLAGLIAWVIAYIQPRIVISTVAVLSAGFMLIFPFALKDMEPLEVIHEHQSLLMKQSYAHRLFILKRSTDMIFEQPLVGHGLDFYRTTINHPGLTPAEKETLVTKELFNTLRRDPGEEYNLQLLSQTTHPHNLTLQIWLELGAVGAILYALFILTSLWKIARLPNCRFEQATFMGLFTSTFVVAHISFGAWQTWWLFGVSIIFALHLRQLSKAH